MDAALTAALADSDSDESEQHQSSEAAAAAALRANLRLQARIKAALKCTREAMGAPLRERNAALDRILIARAAKAPLPPPSPLSFIDLDAAAAKWARPPPAAPAPPLHDAADEELADTPAATTALAAVQRAEVLSRRIEAQTREVEVALAGMPLTGADEPAAPAPAPAPEPAAPAPPRRRRRRPRPRAAGAARRRRFPTTPGKAPALDRGRGRAAARPRLGLLRPNPRRPLAGRRRGDARQDAEAVPFEVDGDAAVESAHSLIGIRRCDRRKVGARRAADIGKSRARPRAAASRAAGRDGSRGRALRRPGGRPPLGLLVFRRGRRAPADAVRVPRQVDADARPDHQPAALVRRRRRGVGGRGRAARRRQVDDDLQGRAAPHGRAVPPALGAEESHLGAGTHRARARSRARSRRARARADRRAAPRRRRGG